MRLVHQFLVVTILMTSGLAADSQTGTISGIVYDASTQNPLPGVTVSIIDNHLKALADAEGKFIFRGLSPGSHELEISHIGYETQRIRSVAISRDDTITMTINMNPRPIRLRNVIVPRGAFGITGVAPVAKQTLARREIAAVPQLGDDLLRAIANLPGMTGNDISTRFIVRGGEFNETLVNLDGLQINQPFHLRDLDGGAMSMIDAAAIESIELLTGAFPVCYGDRMSAVLDIRSRIVPPNQTRVSVALSLINSRALAEGNFNGNRGSWLISARRCYLDYLLHLADEDKEVSPSYYDVFAKLQFDLGKGGILSADLLHAADRNKFEGKGVNDGDTLKAEYGNSYLWLAWLYMSDPRLAIRTTASVGWTDYERRGRLEYDNSRNIIYLAYNRNNFDFTDFKTDWEYEVSNRLTVIWGVAIQHEFSLYDYRGDDYIYAYNPRTNYYRLDHIDTTTIRFTKRGTRFSAYLADRLLPAQQLIVELGARFDYVSHTGDDILSPRLDVVYNPAVRTTVRAGWGYYYQTEGIDEMSIGDGEREFYPAQKAEHRIIGVEQMLSSGISLHLEAYEKLYSNLRPSFRNSFNTPKFFPEREHDRMIVQRIESKSRGLELYLKGEIGSKWSWRLSYALSKVQDSMRYIFFPIDNVEDYHNEVMPAPFDQRHTFYLYLDCRPTANWQLSSAFRYHTGWPYTDAILYRQQTQSGTYYDMKAGRELGAKHRPYARWDIRLDKLFRFPHGQISTYLEVLNVLNRKNIYSYQYEMISGRTGFYIEKKAEYWFMRVFTLGISCDLFL